MVNWFPVSQSMFKEVQCLKIQPLQGLFGFVRIGQRIPRDSCVQKDKYESFKIIVVKMRVN